MPRKAKFPCGECSRACKDRPKIGEESLKCDNCPFWYHVKCIVMNPLIFEGLKNNSATWICCQCAMPSFSSSLFDSYSSLENNNSFEPLQNLNGTTPPLGTPPTSPFKPTESSTPNKPCKNASTKPPKQPSRSSLATIYIH